MSRRTVSFPDPSPRAPVGKRDQPPSPAFSPAGLAQFGFSKRQNVLPSPMHRQRPHHEVLRQEVAKNLKISSTPQPVQMQVAPQQIQQGQQRRQMAKGNENMQTSNVVIQGLSNGVAGPVAPGNPVASKMGVMMPPPPPSNALLKSVPIAKMPASSSSSSSSTSAKQDQQPATGGGGRWTKEEDDKLREGVTTIGATKWKKISEEYLGGRRSDVQCLHRWQKVLRPGLVKGPWTEEEDNMIRACIERKITKWSEIAERIPGRIGKQCRERWFNHLDPTIDHSLWTEEEEKVLVTAQAKFGNRWCEIAKLLPGRPENAVKNRWNSAIRRKWQLKLGLTVTDNKGKAIDPQPIKPIVTMPLPPLVPVVKEKIPAPAVHPSSTPGFAGLSSSNQGKPSASSSISKVPTPFNMQQLPNQVPAMTSGFPSQADAKAAAKAVKAAKAKERREKAAAMKKEAAEIKLENSNQPKKRTTKKPTSDGTSKPRRARQSKKQQPLQQKQQQQQQQQQQSAAFRQLDGAHTPHQLDFQFAGGALGGASPVGPLQWDFQDNILDLVPADMAQLGIDPDMFLGPNSTKHANQPLNISINSMGNAGSQGPWLQTPQASGALNTHQFQLGSSGIINSSNGNQQSQQNTTTQQNQENASQKSALRLTGTTPRGGAADLLAGGLLSAGKTPRGRTAFPKPLGSLVSPLGPMAGWDSLQPGELDKNMASLTLSMLDHEYEGLGPGPRTDDSFGLNWNPAALASPFSPSK